MRRCTLTLTLLLVSTSLAVAQNRPVSVPPDSARGQAAAQFQQEHGPDWQISWHKKAGTPATLLGGTVQGYAGPSKQAGRAFLRTHKTLFGIQNVRRGLKVASSSRSENGSSRVQYRQVYKDIPVLYSGYLVAFNPEGAVHYVSGDYYPDLKVREIQPSLQPRDVASVMRSDPDLRGSGFEVAESPKLRIYVDTEGEELSYHLAYVAGAGQTDPLKSYKYVIDAHNGEVLYKVSLIEDANIVEEGSSKSVEAKSDENAETKKDVAPNQTTGTGKVYQTNPLHNDLGTRTLFGLNNNSPVTLNGDYVEVFNDSGSDASSSTGDFIYGTSDPHFDEVMVYYHSDRFHRWLINRGMSSGRLGGVAEAHTNINSGYAYATGNAIYFGDENSQSGAKNPTKEAAVITHEYTHLVSDTYNNLTQNPDADAMDEAYSDFFAVAYRFDFGGVSSTVQGEYVDVDNPEGPCDHERDLDNSHSVDDSNKDYDGCGGVDEHDRGRIIGGALWDVKQSIGDVQTAAEITLESLKNLDSNPSFYDARTAMIAAANSTGNSQHVCDIKQAFNDHGIGKAFSVTLSGDGVLDTGEQGTWTASVGSCGSGTPSYNWEYMAVGSSSWSSAICTGTSCSHYFFNYGSTQLERGHMKVTVTKGSEQEHATMSVVVRPVSWYTSLGEGDVLVRPSSTGEAPGRVVAFGGLVASAGGSGTADLRWSTTAPLPPSEFVVQHRTDPTAEWSKVGTVDAADTVRVDTTAGPAYRFETDELEPGDHQFGLTYSPPGVANGSRWTSEAVTATLEMKSAYELSAYPNPVRNRATIELAVRDAQDVTVAVYDVLGRRIRTLHNGPLAAQEQHRFSLDAQGVGLPSGSYFVRARGETFRDTKRLTVVR